MDEQDNIFPGSPVWTKSFPSTPWPRETPEDDRDYVIHGRFDNLPQESSKVVRIFLSSTFTDTYCERNLLIKNVYPRLRAVCRQKYDLDFQVVDMRWGIRNEASVDHGASELCMKEIQNCQRLSVGPTFVALLSHRYGSCPLPTHISEDEMSAIKHCITTDQDYQKHLDLVNKWYKLDQNALPNDYILLPLVHNTDLDSFLQDLESKSAIPNDFRRNFLGNLPDEQLSLFYDNPEVDEALTNMFRQQHETNEGQDPEEIELHNQICEEDKAKKEELLAEYNKLLSKGKSAWQTDEPILASVVKQAVTKAVQTGLMSDQQSQKYFQSVTEEEVIRGLVNEPESKSRCLVFIRHLENIDTKHSKAWRFIDLDDQGRVDEFTQQRLNTMKDDVLPKHLPAENIFRFKTSWSDDEGVNESDNADYLEEFCKEFESSVLKLVEEGVGKSSELSGDELFTEVLAHNHQCVQKVKRFQGREEILQTIKSYLMSTSDQPLVIHGESGCGKTSLMAKAATLVPEWFGDSKELMITLRFLGSTPDSSSIHATLHSATKQIITLTRIESDENQVPNIAEDFSELKDMFLEVIASIPETKRLVIFFDSLDQLSSEDNAHKMYWLPKNIPSNVKMIVSTVPNSNGILDRLKSAYFNLDQKQFISVDNLDVTLSNEVITSWLSGINRTLTDTQKDILEGLLSTKNSPLYLKLLFDEIAKWKSYDTPVFRCTNVKSCIQRLYRILETKHGAKIVSRALGYVAASQNGLSQSEIEDILSLDDVVLSDVFEFHIPPIRHLPSILWTRIRQDMDEYIVDKDANGVRVMGWYHQQFTLEANKRYLPGTSLFGHLKGKNTIALSFYKTLSEFFSGIWSGNKPKPFTYTEKQRKKLGLASAESQAVRYVASQPNIFGKDNKSLDVLKFRYNERKTTELPASAIVVHKFEDNTAAIAEHIALNPQFLAAWIVNTPWQQIDEFMEAVSIDSQYKETEDDVSKVDEQNESTGELIQQIATVLNCLLLSYTRLKKNPTFIGSEVSGRLLQYNSSFKGITNWIGQTDLEERNLCAFVAPHLQLETPGSELMLVVNNHSGPIVDSDWSIHENTICVSGSKRFVVNSLDSGHVMIDTRPRSVPSGDSFRYVTSAVDGTGNPVYLASLVNNPWVYIFDSDGEVVNVINFNPREPSFQISGLRWIKCDAKLKVMVFDCSKKSFLVAEDVLTSNITYQEIEMDVEILELITQIKSKGKREVRNSDSENEEEKEVNDDQGNTAQGTDKIHKFVVITKNGLCQLFLACGTQIDKRDLKWPNVAVHSYTYNEHRAMIAIGFSNGQYCVLQWDPLCEDLTHIHLLYLFKDADDIPTEYREPHYVHHHQIIDTSKYFDHSVALACTDTSLIAFASKSLFDEYNKPTVEEQSNVTEVNSSDQKANGMTCLKLICRIKKRYNLAVYSSQLEFIFGADRGTVDIYQIGDLNKLTNMKIEVNYFGKLDVHGSDITNILPTAIDITFLTTSKDSTMKLFMLSRVGLARKYVPALDHADDHIIQVVSGDNVALTLSQNSSMVFIWSMFDGRVKSILQNPHRCTLLTFAVDKLAGTVVTVDTGGSVLSWDIQAIKDGCNGTEELAMKKVKIFNPNRTLSLRSEISVNSQPVMVTYETGTLLVFKHAEDVYFIQPNDGTCEKMEQIKGPIEHIVELADQQVLLASDKQCHVVKITDGTFQIISQTDFSLQKNEDLTQKPRDVKFMRGAGSEIFQISGNEVIIWHPSKGIRTSTIPMELLVVNEKISLTKPEELASAILPNRCRAYIKDSENAVTGNDKASIKSIGEAQHEKSHNNYMAENVTTVNDLIQLRPNTGEELRFCEVTCDGKYVIHVAGDAEVYLTRIADGQLIAWYTMYDKVEYMTTSTNSWFVLLATADKRLFTLLIADPDKREHDDRVSYVRSMNFKLTRNQSLALMTEINGFPDGNESSFEYETLKEYFDHEAMKLQDKLKECQALLKETEYWTMMKPIEILYDEINVNKRIMKGENQLFSVTPCLLQ